MQHVDPRAKRADPPHRSRLNVARGAGRMAETNDSSARWRPWAELGPASGAVPGRRCELEPAGQRAHAGRGEDRARGWEGSLASLMGPKATGLDLTGPAHSLSAG